MSEAHYRFPPSAAYRLNRCLYALKSDRDFAERFLADPRAATEAMGLSEGERADVLRLDRDALHACAAALRGTHDFTAFTPTETDHVRFERDVLSAEWREDGELLEFWITADTFMRHMNRVLVGTMLDVAAGNRTVEAFAALLAGAPRSAAAQTAPPHGLALASVAY